MDKPEKDPIHSIAKALYDHDAEKFGSGLHEMTNPELFIWGIEAKRFMVMMKADEEAKK